MKKELLQEYTVRVTQSNRTQLVVVIYEIMLEYIKDSRVHIKEGDLVSYRKALRKVQQLLQELVSALDFQYTLSNQLLALYLYANRILTKAMIKNNPKRLCEVESMIKKLHIAFSEVAKQDFSAPLMSNTQQVYAGLTYGRGTDLNIYQEQEYNRGFQA